MKRHGIVRVSREVSIWLRSNPIAGFKHVDSQMRSDGGVDVTLESVQFDQVEEGAAPHYSVTIQPSVIGFHAVQVSPADEGCIIRLGGSAPFDTIVIQS